MTDADQQSLWDLALFLMKERNIVQSLLEYLRSSDDPPEAKSERLVNWEKYVGLQLGNPQIDAEAHAMLQTILDAPAEVRNIVIQKYLAQKYDGYL
jgi:hypothetical protein